MDWVKCKDRMPELGAYVLGYIPRSVMPINIFILQYCVERYRQHEGLFERLLFRGPERTWVPDWVTHWAPLPSKPVQDHIEQSLEKVEL